ncbi:hypothetical protein ASC95_27305 [Pelomonas sp. Root1217]|uniref:hypothetical protein n=1 Tax=Pelomonas sp. Root1217 TaxID=1736430 RepID=UPI00070A6889|nr:hypothetical protein [Pelomonas sp. Root1217]KQV46308.1 hypothetical protein ASC95_27305 [Pelomonas sp. Root1217]
MTHLRLPGGTDVAEMALFDIDALPAARPDDSTVAALEASNRLVRFPTGGDGGYLLHLYVDEPIPAGLQRYCLADDKLTGAFRTEQGNVAFGGIESTFVGFKPNRHIRADGTIPPGEYRYTAFHTEFPDELVSRTLRVEATSSELWLSRAPVVVSLATIALAVALAVSQRFAMAGLGLLVGYFAVKFLRKAPAYQALVSRRDAAQLDLPSIAVELRSAAASQMPPAI